MSAEICRDWRAVWSKRTPPIGDAPTSLASLIELDGFDTPLGAMDETDWRRYVVWVCEMANIQPGHSIFEVGCGAGAFLYPLYSTESKLGGIDFSSGLVGAARMAMPNHNDDLNVCDAAELEVKPAYDAIISNHVFHYFPSLEYARNVLGVMLQKARKTVVLTGLPDADMESESESFRRGLLSEQEYEEKYSGLSLIYFSRDWLSLAAKQYGFASVFHPHRMPNFAQNQFRFDCVLTSKK